MQLVTRSEAASLLDMSVRTLDRIVQSGKLGKYYLSEGIVRLSVEEIEAYKKGCRVVTGETKKARKKTKPQHRAQVNMNWKPGEKLV